jgi:hypothetical protein
VVAAAAVDPAVTVLLLQSTVHGLDLVMEYSKKGCSLH